MLLDLTDTLRIRLSDMLAPPTAATSPSTALSPAQTLVDGRVPQKYSAVRRYVLLIMFCLAQFLDAFNNGALFSAIPELVDALGMTESESTWLISAFQLTFASFLHIVSSSGGLSAVSLAPTHLPLAERAYQRRLQPE